MRPTPLIALLAALLLPGWSAARAVEMPVPPPAGTAPGTPVPI